MNYFIYVFVPFVFIYMVAIAFEKFAGLDAKLTIINIILISILEMRNKQNKEIG